MQILVPSRARARPDQQIIAKRLTEAGIPFKLVRTAGDETDYSQWKYDEVVLELPAPGGICEKRNAMLDAFPGKTFVIDDDIVFRRPIEGTTYEVRDDELRHLMECVDFYLNDYAHVGVAQRFMIQTRKKPYDLNKRMMGCRGFNTELFPTPAPRYRMRTCSDVDFNMQLLAAGKTGLVITEYCHTETKYKSPGGCSVWRTEELILEGHRELRRLWPGYVELRREFEPGEVRATIHMAKLAKDHGA